MKKKHREMINNIDEKIITKNVLRVPIGNTYFKSGKPSALDHIYCNNPQKYQHPK